MQVCCSWLSPGKASQIVHIGKTIQTMKYTNKDFEDKKENKLDLQSLVNEDEAKQSYGKQTGFTGALLVF